uniref:Ribosomal L1 domain-containing protein n=1 Tax=Anopheles atroparvus TaxID=41427 RepID=A0AAG5DD78_ANOAO
MKAKVDKVKKTPASKLVGIKKTKVDIQKAKKPKKELKADTMKVVASSVAATLTFAEKQVLSVKRKTKAAKATPESKPNGENASVKPKVAKVAKTNTVSERTAEPAAEKVSVKKNSTKKAVGGPKQIGEKRKPENETAGVKRDKKKILKQQEVPAADVASEEKKSPKASAEGAKIIGKKRKHGKAKSQEKKGEKKPKQPREVGPVAKEVSEETLALVPKQLISAANFKVLFEHVKKKASQVEANRLFGDDIKYSLFITAVKIPRYPARNARVTLPHATMRNDDDACLIVPGLIRGRNVDYNPTLHHWQDKLRALGIGSSLQIIPFQQLKRDFDQYEMKRKLVNRFARFMVDARISGHVFGFLGKPFIQRRKNPIPVKLDKEIAIKKNIEKALRTETYNQTNVGNQTSIKFAAEWMPVEHAVENGMALIEQLKTIHPGGWLNIQSIHLVSACTFISSFPLYMSVIDPNLVPVPHCVGPREAFVAKQDAEMQKATGGKYGVTADGLLRTINPAMGRKIKRTGQPQPSDQQMVTDEGNPAGNDKVKVAAVDKHNEEVDEEVERDDIEGEEEDDEDENYDSQDLSSEEDE